jgi:hypothetical protein
MKHKDGKMVAPSNPQRDDVQAKLHEQVDEEGA